jgi:hypothetical protein
LLNFYTIIFVSVWYNINNYVHVRKLWVSDVTGVLVFWNTKKKKKRLSLVIVWQLDLQLHVQSLPITTNIVSINPTYGKVIKFVSDLRQVSGFLHQ